MTVVVSYRNSDIVVMAADLLVSTSASKRKEAVELPGRPTKSFPVTDLHLAGLHQKIFCISDTLAVGWAGNYVLARRLAEAITEKVRRPYAWEAIERVIKNSGLSETELDEVGVLVHALNLDKDGNPDTIIRNGHNTQFYKLDAHPEIDLLAAGSGVFHFVDWIKFNLVPHGGSFNELESAVANIICRNAVAFFSELLSTDTHDFLYGGGFELIARIGAKFEKTPYTMVFWFADREKRQLVPTGPVYSYRYRPSGMLELHRLVRIKGKWVHRAFLVPHMLMQADTANSDPILNIDTMIVAHIFVQHDNEQGFKANIGVQKGGPGEKQVSVTYDGQAVQTTIRDPSFIDQFWQSVDGNLRGRPGLR